MNSISPTCYVLLNRLVERKAVYETLLTGDDHYLEPLFTELAAQDLVRITGSTYQVTRQGRERYEEWIRRYYDRIPRLEVFSAVDLKAGKFAFSRYFDFSDNLSWEDYLNQSRFQDVRLAVCEYQGVDREEIVFMSFLNEGRWKDLDTTPGWQFDLGSGKIFEEVKDIIKNSITVKDLGYEGPQGYISGEMVIEDIIHQGEALSLKLWEEEKSRGREPKLKMPEKLEKETGLDDAYNL